MELWDEQSVGIFPPTKQKTGKESSFPTRKLTLSRTVLGLLHQGLTRRSRSSSSRDREREREAGRISLLFLLFLEGSGMGGVNDRSETEKGNAWVREGKRESNCFIFLRKRRLEKGKNCGGPRTRGSD